MRAQEIRFPVPQNPDQVSPYARWNSFVRKVSGEVRVGKMNAASPRIEVSCTLATLAYVNQGSVTQGTSRSAVARLETATSRYAAGQSRAVFVESMPEAN
jgi:hypothetical protein